MVESSPEAKLTGGNEEWLSLKDASHLLDVSNSTLRLWADAGHVRVYRTPGGHRRFLRQDLESLTSSPQPAVASDSGEAPALRRIRRRLSQNSVTQQPWFQAVEPQGHDRMRLFGRRLLSLLLQENGTRRHRQELLAEARMLGQEYGSEMVDRDVALTDSVEAFVFFRSMVLDGAPESSWSRILETSDRVLAGLCAAYQRSAESRTPVKPPAPEGEG